MLNLGLQMEELIFELADTHLFFNDLEVRYYAALRSASLPIKLPLASLLKHGTFLPSSGM